MDIDPSFQAEDQNELQIWRQIPQFLRQTIINHSSISSFPDFMSWTGDLFLVHW
jgi:hypothetical protein